MIQYEFFSWHKKWLTENNYLNFLKLSMILYINNSNDHMCRVKFLGLSLIVELLLKTIHFIQGVSTNNLPLYFIIVTTIKVMGTLALINVVSDLNPVSGIFRGLALVYCFFLQTFYPTETIKTKICFRYVNYVLGINSLYHVSSNDVVMVSNKKLFSSYNAITCLFFLQNFHPIS